MTMMSGTKASRRLEDTRKTRILMTHTLAETRRREDHAALMFPRRQKKAKKVLKKCPSLVHFLKKSWRNTWSFAAALPLILGTASLLALNSVVKSVYGIVT